MLAFLELMAGPVLGSGSGGTLGGRSLGLAQPLPGLCLLLFCSCLSFVSSDSSVLLWLKASGIDPQASPLPSHS